MHCAFEKFIHEWVNEMNALWSRPTQAGWMFRGCASWPCYAPAILSNKSFVFSFMLHKVLGPISRQNKCLPVQSCSGSNSQKVYRTPCQQRWVRLRPSSSVCLSPEHIIYPKNGLECSTVLCPASAMIQYPRKVCLWLCKSVIFR